MKKTWSIILQLHADGEPAAPPAATNPVATAEPAPTPTPAPASEPTAPASSAAPAQQPAPAAEPTQQAVQPTPAPAQPEYKVLADTGMTLLVEEPNGQRRIITKEAQQTQTPVPETAPNQPTQTVNQVPAADPAPAQAPQPQQATEQPAVIPQPEAQPPLATTPQPLPPYTTDELTLAIQLGAVDESRIPPSLAIQYGQFKERQAQQQAIANGQQEAAKPTQQDEIQQRIAFMQQVEKTAHDLTLQQLGLTEEDISDSEYADYSDNKDLGERVKNFKTMQEYNKQRIINDVLQEQAKAQQAAAAQKAVNDSVMAFVQKEMRQEPKFSEINKALLEHYKTLPFEKAQRYFNAINALNTGKLTEASAKDLQEYYDETKKAVYAKANNLSTTPQPVVRRPASVESPGTGLNTPKQADASELSSLDYLGKLAWFGKNT